MRLFKKVGKSSSYDMSAILETVDIEIQLGNPRNNFHGVHSASSLMQRLLDRSSVAPC